jgi:predicted transcriptional regulator
MGRNGRPAAATVAEALAMATSEVTVAELAERTGLGASTVGKALTALEQRGQARRSPGGQDKGRRRPDRWASVPVTTVPGRSAPATAATSETPAETAGSVAPAPDRSRREDRLGRGKLAGLVLDSLHAGGGQPMTAGAVAKTLDRSAGAVSNCLQRLADGGQVSLVEQSPRRYRLPG